MALLRDLDCDDFQTREQASAQVTELAADEEKGMAVVSFLRKKLHQRAGSTEARRRMARIVERLEQPHRLAVIRSVEVLERIGNAESTKLLEALAEAMPDAKEALGRLR